jgi:hypothetical protein
MFSSTAVLLSGQSGPANPAASRTKMTEEVYKNIQTLKGIPADQLIPAMQFITYSLGVECSFCHVEGAFEKDDKKPKQTARKMMQMMFAHQSRQLRGKARGDLLLVPSWLPSSCGHSVDCGSRFFPCPGRGAGRTRTAAFRCAKPRA